jgi:hypothetical protein
MMTDHLDRPDLADVPGGREGLRMTRVRYATVYWREYVTLSIREWAWRHPAAMRRTRTVVGALAVVVALVLGGVWVDHHYAAERAHIARLDAPVYLGTGTDCFGPNEVRDGPGYDTPSGFACVTVDYPSP